MQILGSFSGFFFSQAVKCCSAVATGEFELEQINGLLIGFV